jgi:hypothetical protein
MKRFLLIVLVGGSFFGLFFSCDLLSGPVSASRRLQLFEADLVAGNYADLVNHISQDDTTTDISAINATYWDSTSFKETNNPTAITQDSSSTSGDIVTINATLVTDVSDFPYVFTLSPDASGDYYIYEIYDVDANEYEVKIP